MTPAVGELGREGAAALVPLYGYQQRYISDTAELKAMLWSRSAGKTFAITLEPVIDCMLAEAEGRQVSWFFLSASEGQTMELVRYAAIHAQAIALGADLDQLLHEEEHEVMDRDGNKHKVTMLSVTFPGGSRIVGLPTNPYSIRGKHGNLIVDEMGHMPDADEVWRAAAMVATRAGFKIRVCGTAGVRRGPFYEICTGIRAGWSVHRTDIYQAIADGAPIDIAKVKAAIGSGRAFAIECELQWEDADSRLIGLELITPCEREDVLLVDELDVGGDRPGWELRLDAKDGSRADGPIFPYDLVEAWARLFRPLVGRRSLFLGYDVGRKRHLSSLFILERFDRLRLVRAVVRLHKRRFAEQRACLWTAMALCERGCIDASGIGAQLGEDTEEKFGAARAEALQFTGPVKEDLALRVLRMFEDQSARLPRSQPVRESIHSVYKETTKAGHVRYDADATEETGHADDFWALGLAALAAGDGPQGMPHIESFGAPQWTREAML